MHSLSLYIYTHICTYACVFSHSVVSDSFVISWTVAHQAPLSMEFPRQEYWRGLPWLSSPPLGDLPNPGIQPTSPALQEDSLPLSHQESPYINSKPQKHDLILIDEDKNRNYKTTKSEFLLGSATLLTTIPRRSHSILKITIK